MEKPFFSQKQLLILILIALRQGTNDIYTLVKLFDRADFPANLRESMDLLFSQKLIVVSETFSNGTPKAYEITEIGMEVLRNNLNHQLMLEYLDGLHNDKFLRLFYHKGISELALQ